MPIHRDVPRRLAFNASQHIEVEPASVAETILGVGGQREFALADESGVLSP
jgi:hypothetical protein